MANNKKMLACEGMPYFQWDAQNSSIRFLTAVLQRFNKNRLPEKMDGRLTDPQGDKLEGTIIFKSDGL